MTYTYTVLVIFPGFKEIEDCETSLHFTVWNGITEVDKNSKDKSEKPTFGLRKTQCLKITLIWQIVKEEQQEENTNM